jgi:hypothetical protein
MSFTLHINIANFVPQVRQHEVLHVGIELFVIFGTFADEAFLFAPQLLWPSAFLCGSSEDSLVNNTV